MCEEYLKAHHKPDLLELLKNEDISKHFSLNINFLVLYEHQPDLVVNLLNVPEKCLEDWDKATLMAQLAVMKESSENSLLKNNVHCRIFNLPFWPAVRRTIFPGNNDAGKFLQLSGTVMRITSAKLLEYQRNYVCPKCKTPSLVKAEYDRKYIIKQPKKCGNPEGCSSNLLVNFGDLDSENCKDYQEVKIQEQIKKLGVGSMPNTMWVTLEDDLVDSCKPGDNVTICGIVKRRWGEFDKGKKIDIDLVFKANHVQVDNSNSSISSSTPEVKEMFNTFWEKYKDNPLEGRDSILKSFCPQIYGLYLVKLAIAVVLAGGSHTEDSTSTGVHTRSEPHLLLVGDPGTGKSQLLRYASKIIPRSVLTTGVGSTSAGLTVTATMEHGEWQLEGGALVMADGGICCIDEFNSMKEHDRTSIHEAMEQQTISVAKASMVCKLNTRCSILAACNPKGNLDPAQPLSMNIALPSPLLSRFDLILLMRDTVNEEWDDSVADYILNGGSNLSKLTDSGIWTTDVLQTYFVTIKKIHPKLTTEAELILGAYYQMQRRIDNRNKARTTVRLLESLIRLSQGHARLMGHKNVEVMDSIYAIVLVDTAMDWDSGILSLNVTLNSIFPERPHRDYRQMLEAVLNKLNLHQILDKEINSLSKSKNNGVKSRFFHDQKLAEDGGEERNGEPFGGFGVRHEIDFQGDTEDDNVSRIFCDETSDFHNVASPKKLGENTTKSTSLSSETDEGYKTISFDKSIPKKLGASIVESKIKTNLNLFETDIDTITDDTSEWFDISERSKIKSSNITELNCKSSCSLNDSSGHSVLKAVNKLAKEGSDSELCKSTELNCKSSCSLNDSSGHSELRKSTELNCQSSRSLNDSSGHSVLKAVNKLAKEGYGSELGKSTELNFKTSRSLNDSSGHSVLKAVNKLAKEGSDSELRKSTELNCKSSCSLNDSSGHSVLKAVNKLAKAGSDSELRKSTESNCKSSCSLNDSSGHFVLKAVNKLAKVGFNSELRKSTELNCESSRSLNDNSGHYVLKAVKEGSDSELSKSTKHNVLNVSSTYSISKNISESPGKGSDSSNKCKELHSDKGHKFNSAQSLKEKMKRFKFTRKVDHDIIPPEIENFFHETAQSDEKIILDRKSENEIKSDCVKGKRKSRSNVDSNKEVRRKKLSRQKESTGNSIDSSKKDLEMLKHMPGVNDSFNIDLDMEWDNQSQNDSSDKCDIFKSSLKSTIARNYSSDSVNNVKSLLRSDTVPSQSARTIFECSEDDLNFEL